MLVASACPHFSRLTQFTWFGAAQTQLQLYGFFAITMFGAIYYILPRAVGIEFAFPKLIRVQHWCAMLGLVIFVVSLVIGGVEQGMKLQDPNVAFADLTKAMLPFLRVSTLGLLFLLIANLLFALNVFAMIARLEMVGGQIRVRRRDCAVAQVGGESMKNGFVIFLAAFAVLAASWGAFVLGPQLQLGGAKQVAVLNSSDIYPHNRPGEANQGLQIYRANGCAACHTEQVQQTGVACDVVLTAAGKKSVGRVQSGCHFEIERPRPRKQARSCRRQNHRRRRQSGDAHHRHRPGHRARLGFAPQRRGRFSLRQSGAARQPAHRAGFGGCGRASAGCELAVAPSLRAAKRRERFRHAAVPLSV